MAEKTLDHLKHPVPMVPELAAMSILNFIRLVNMYRYSDMRTLPMAHSPFECEQFDHELDEFEPTDPLEDVQKAMDAARKKAFSGLSRAQAGEKLYEALIWHLEMPNDRPDKNEKGDGKAKLFLKVFIDALPAT
jgi:hypothetical protein